jgi:hypothetical protein
MRSKPFQVFAGIPLTSPACTCRQAKTPIPLRIRRGHLHLPRVNPPRRTAKLPSFFSAHARAQIRAAARPRARPHRPRSRARDIASSGGVAAVPQLASDPPYLPNRAPGGFGIYMRRPPAGGERSSNTGAGGRDPPRPLRSVTKSSVTRCGRSSRRARSSPGTGESEPSTSPRSKRKRGSRASSTPSRPPQRTSQDSATAGSCAGRESQFAFSAIRAGWRPRVTSTTLRRV